MKAIILLFVLLQLSIISPTPVDKLNAKPKESEVIIKKNLSNQRRLGIVDFFKKVYEYSPLGIAQKVGEQIVDLVKAHAKKPVEKLVEKIDSSIESAKDIAKKVITNVKDKVVDTVINVKDKVVDTVTNVKDKVTSGIKNVTKVVTNQVKDKYNAIKKKITDILTPPPEEI
jgi:gas vesicle protein